MLAAGNGKNRFCFAAERVVERVIGGGVAGMERYDDVGLLFFAKRSDVARGKLKICEREFLRERVAIGNHIFFEVKPEDFTRDFFDRRKIVLNGKGEIRFSRAEVHDAERIFRRNRIPLAFPQANHIAQHIIEHFKKAVDLSEFVVLRANYLPFRRHNPQMHQKRHRRAFGKKIAFGTRN